MNKEKALEKLGHLKGRYSTFGTTTVLQEDENGKPYIDSELCKIELDKTEKWKRDTKTAIGYIFKESTNKRYYVNKIEKLQFAVLTIDHDMKKAEELFEEMVSEINEYWD